MHVMATAWLMVELTGSSFLATLIQTAVFLPMFVLSLPAGVLADTTDRRRVMLAAPDVHRRRGQQAGEGDRRRSGRGADLLGVMGKEGLYDKPA